MNFHYSNLKWFSIRHTACDLFWNIYFLFNRTHWQYGVECIVQNYMYGFYVHPIKKDEIRMGKGKVLKIIMKYDDASSLISTNATRCFSWYKILNLRTLIHLLCIDSFVSKSVKYYEQNVWISGQYEYSLILIPKWHVR